MDVKRINVWKRPESELAHRFLPAVATVCRSRRRKLRHVKTTKSQMENTQLTAGLMDEGLVMDGQER